MHCERKRKMPENRNRKFSNADRNGSSQQQNNGRKRKRRKKNLTLYYILIFVIMATSLVVLSMTVFFNIQEITILGGTIYTPEEIIATAKVKNGDNLFRINTGNLEQNIQKGLVNIEEVKISRKLPAGLEISVTPCIETYNLEHDGGYYIISKNGKLLTDKLSEPKQGLLIVKGFEPENVEISTVISSTDTIKKEILDEIIEAISEYSFEHIDSVDITDRVNILIKYDNRIEIQLGSSLDLKYKINFAKVVINENTDDSFEGILTMRGDNGASLIKKGEKKEQIVGSSGNVGTKVME